MDQQTKELINTAKFNKNFLKGISVIVNINGNAYPLQISGIRTKSLRLSLFVSYEDILKYKNHRKVEHMLYEKITKVYPNKKGWECLESIMKYGENYTLKYISKENGKLLFDVVDEMGNNRVLDGTMQDLRKILHYSNDLTIEIPFKTLQDAIFNNPIVFIAKRRKLQTMDDLDFNI